MIYSDFKELKISSLGFGTMRLPTLGGNDADIDIAPEYEDLLPLCMAYYVWLEDEPNKAAFFLARFNEMAALARQTYKRSGSNTVISYNGW